MRRATTVTALLASVSIGCSTDTMGPATPSDLVGSWNASSYVVANVANNSEMVSMTDLGIGFVLSFTSTTMSGTVYFGNWDDQESFTGSYTVNGTDLVFTDPASGSQTFRVNLYGDGNMLDLVTNTLFDFDGDGQEEPATTTITLVRA